MEEGRRFRRFGIERGRVLTQPRSVLPLRSPSRSSTIVRPRLSYTLSCWYCDLQIYAIFEPIFRFSRRNARYLRAWFSVGVGFGATLMLVLFLFLLWELAGSLHFHDGNPELSKLVFGFSPSVSGLRISLSETGYILLATLISVSTHEIGHIVAAASEGVQVEHLAIFLAVLFPGALVAFNQESLQALQPISALRIYCAGIWHNAVCCAICGLMLLLLPSILSPMYIYGQGPMVLEVSESSPLHGYLSPGDVVLALDDIPVHDVREWMEAVALVDGDSDEEPNLTTDTLFALKRGDSKGYCVPRDMIEESERANHVDNVSTCPDDLSGFTSMPCSDAYTMDYDSLGDRGDRSTNSEEHIVCLNAQEVIKLEKCGDGWSHIVSNGSSCPCLQGGPCFTAVKSRGSTWVEVTYLRPYRSPECSQVEQKLQPNAQTSEYTDRNCTGTFVYVGDLFALSNSVHFTSYRPRFWRFSVSAFVPTVVEKILTLTYHVSLTLALLNTLPVIFLDGESILEVKLSYCSFLSRRKRKHLLRLILTVGTLMSVISFVKMVSRV